MIGTRAAVLGPGLTQDLEQCFTSNLELRGSGHEGRKGFCSSYPSKKAAVDVGAVVVCDGESSDLPLGTPVLSLV